MPNYDINYDDTRFQEVQSDKNAALSELENTYGGMISDADKYYQAQIDASKQWADKQTQLQQEKTDFAIQEVEQQKAQAQKDYLKEQSGAYVDWQKQSNQYGTNAEQMASAGLTNTGFSESSQVSMYNTYQSRVATARESYNLAVQNYNNSITEARLQNNSILAEIAFEALQTQLELSLQGFQYKNTLIQAKADKKTQLDSEYYSRYQDVLKQINQENALAEEVRQYNESLAEEKRQYNQTYKLEVQKYEESVRQFNKEYSLQKQKFEEDIRQFNEEIARLKKKDAQEHAMEIKNLELKKKQVQDAQKQWESEMALKKEQLAEEKRQFNETMAYNKSKSSGSSGGSGGGGGSKKSSSNTSSIKKSSSKSSGSKNINKVSNTNPTMKSIINLGYGPISAKNLANKVALGEVKETTKNGVTTFTNTKKTSSKLLSNTSKAKSYTGAFGAISRLKK